MSIKDGVLREQLCQVGKLLYDKGLVVGTQGNFSCRNTDGQILISPAGKCKGMLQPEDIVLIEPSGTPVDSRQRPSTEYLLHLQGYKHRSDFQAVVHAHPPYATSFALARIVLDAFELPEGRATFGEIPLVRYAEPGTQALADRLSGLIHDYHTFLLEGHGIIAFGSNLMEAFFRIEMAEHLARTIYLSRQLTGIALMSEDGAFTYDDEGLDEDEDETDIPPTRGRG